MRQPEGYAVQKRLVSNASGQVYTAVRLSDQRDVVLKTSDASLLDGGAALRAEFEALRAARGPGVVEALDLLLDDGPVLVLERVAGISLADARSDRLSIAAFVGIAIRLTAAVGRVHAARWVHGRVSPSSAIVDAEGQHAVLVDFSCAQPLGAAGSSVQAESQRGDFVFMSPERTGRMNRGVDARSDLYSLGATLYFALTGEPPFPGSDPLGLIHAHMARVPRPPREIRPETPDALSRIILKLLEKEPDDRYRSAPALLADLQACADQLARHGRIDEDFVLATAQGADRPHFSSKLYERDAEIARIRELYRLVCEGRTRVLMIAGEPGAGKSALVDELRAGIAQSHGYLALGKFDLSRDRPYGVWSSALTSLVEQFLVESDVRLVQWRQRLSSALGNVAQALVDLVPDLQFVLGEVPAVPLLGARETQMRIALAVRRFVGACAAPEHPLVLFFDDLQWSDAGSREVLEDLLSQSTGLALMVIGAYRANEIQPGDPLPQLLGRLAERQVEIETVALRPLSRAASVRMLADTLRRAPEDVADLAELIERKTGNAPLFVRQFVEHLHDKGLLRHVPPADWIWDASEVAASDIPEGAAELLVAKLRRLESDARRVIEVASCVGDVFDLARLCELSSLEPQTLERGLYALSSAGLILPCRSGFRFAHDRIREAAARLLSDPGRASLRAQMAERLLASLSPEAQAARIFEIVEHVNGGITCWPEERRLEAARLNLTAAQNALALGAAATADPLLETGRSLFRDEDWTDQHELGFELFYRGSESAFLRGDCARALSLADALERQRLSELQRIQVAARRIQVLAFSRTPEEGTRYALELLRSLGVRWPFSPSRLRTLLMLWRVAWAVRGARVELALRPTLAPSPSWMAPIVVLGAAGGLMVRVDSHLGALAASWTVASNVRHGFVGGPTYALAGFAVHLQAIAGATRAAERLESATLDWLARFPDPLWGKKSEAIVYTMLRPWRMSRRRALGPVDSTADALLEVGDVEFSHYARFLKAVYLALAGDPVSRCAQRFDELAASIGRGGHVYREPELCGAAYRMIQSGDRGASITERLAASDLVLASYRDSAEPFVRTMWMMVLCVYGRWESVLAQSEILGERLFRVVPFVHVADHCFYRGVAAAALATRGRRAARWRLGRIVSTSLRRVQRWAKDGHDFQHMALLLDAEQTRLRGKGRRALVLYERAAEAALQQEFLHHAAFALERRGRALLELQRGAEARMAFSAAGERYRAWGATAKALALDEERESLARGRRDA